MLISESKGQVPVQLYRETHYELKRDHYLHCDESPPIKTLVLRPRVRDTPPFDDLAYSD